MSTRDRAQTRADVLRNARAAEKEKLRNEVRRAHPGLSDDEVEARVRDLLREKTSRAGRKGGIATRSRAELGRRVELNREEMLDRVQMIGEHVDALLWLVRSLCLHDWPDDGLDIKALCVKCGVQRLEWSERVAEEAAA